MKKFLSKILSEEYMRSISKEVGITYLITFIFYTSLEKFMVFGRDITNVVRSISGIIFYSLSILIISHFGAKVFTNIKSNNK